MSSPPPIDSASNPASGSRRNSVDGAEQSSTNPASNSGLPISEQGVTQAEQQPLTNTATQGLPNPDDNDPVLQQLLLQSLADYETSRGTGGMQNTGYNCADACLYHLSSNWSLDEAFYQNHDYVDVIEPLMLAGELPYSMYDPSNSDQGFVNSVSGYSFTKLKDLFNNQLDKTKQYILRTGENGINTSGHFRVLYYEGVSKGWVYKDLVFEQEIEIVDINGELTSHADHLAIPEKKWGGEMGQYAFSFIEMTPRRTAILREYLFLYRYFGTAAAENAVRHVADHGSFPARPAKPEVFALIDEMNYPEQEPLPDDVEAGDLDYAKNVVEAQKKRDKAAPLERTTGKRSLGLEVEKKDSSVDRALMVLDLTSPRPNPRHVDGTSTHPTLERAQLLASGNITAEPIDISKVLSQAKMLQRNEGEFVFTPRHNDVLTTDPGEIFNLVERLDKAKLYFIRTGKNDSAGYCRPLKYFPAERNKPAGWYYFDAALNRVLFDESPMNNEPFSSKDPNTYFISCGADHWQPFSEFQDLIPTEMDWGVAADQQSFQLIEANLERRQLLISYISNLRTVSKEAAEALLAQTNRTSVEVEQDKKDSGFHQAVENTRLALATEQARQLALLEEQVILQQVFLESQLTNELEELRRAEQAERARQQPVPGLDEGPLPRYAGQLPHALNQGSITPLANYSADMALRAFEHRDIFSEKPLQFLAPQLQQSSIRHHEQINVTDALLLAGKLDDSRAQDHLDLRMRMTEMVDKHFSMLDPTRHYLIQITPNANPAAVGKVFFEPLDQKWKIILNGQMVNLLEKPATTNKISMTAEARSLLYSVITRDGNYLDFRIDLLDASVPSRLKFLDKYIGKYRVHGHFSAAKYAMLKAVKKNATNYFAREVKLTDGTRLRAAIPVHKVGEHHGKRILPRELQLESKATVRPDLEQFWVIDDPFHPKDPESLGNLQNAGLDKCLYLLEMMYGVTPSQDSIGGDFHQRPENQQRIEFFTDALEMANTRGLIDALNQAQQTHRFSAVSAQSVGDWLGALDKRLPYIILHKDKNGTTRTDAIMFIGGEWYHYNTAYFDANTERYYSSIAMLSDYRGEDTFYFSSVEEQRDFFLDDRDWTGLDSSLVYIPMDRSRVQFLRDYLNQARTVGEQVIFLDNLMSDSSAFPDRSTPTNLRFAPAPPQSQPPPDAQQDQNGEG